MVIFEVNRVNDASWWGVWWVGFLTRDVRCSPSKILRSIYFHLRLIIVKDVSTVAITIFLFKLVVHLHYTHMRHLMHYAIHTYIHQVQISQQDFTRITHLLGTVSLLARVLPSFHESASVGGQYIGGPGFCHEKPWVWSPATLPRSWTVGCFIYSPGVPGPTWCYFLKIRIQLYCELPTLLSRKDVRLLLAMLLTQSMKNVWLWSMAIILILLSQCRWVIGPNAGCWTRYCNLIFIVLKYILLVKKSTHSDRIE